MPILTCEELSFSYENQIVVEELSFAVNKGDYLCIVGENGSGKTTLIKGLLGLKKPTKGRILTEDAGNHKMGYVPQQTEAQKDFPASVQEVVMSGCLNNRGMRPGFLAEDKKKAKDNMELLGIASISKKSYRELSGGQQQRVLLARALCATHSLMLLDEPTTGLDPVVTEEFYELLAKLNKEKGITIIMVSHAVKEAVTYANHILHLSHKTYFFGNTKEYLESDIGKLFLGGASL